MDVRAVTFDFWGTLYDEFGNSSKRREQRRYLHALTFFQLSGAVFDQEKLRQVMEKVPRQVDLLWRLQQRTMGRRELGEWVVQQMGYRVDEPAADALGEALAMAATHAPPALRVGVNGILEGLRGRYKIGLISDTGLSLGCALREVMRADQTLDYFDHLTFSDETGSAKPNPRQFLYTCHMLGVAPEHTVHVGDLEETDIAGAREAGLRSILITNGRTISQTAATATITSMSELPDILKRWEVSE